MKAKYQTPENLKFQLTTLSSSAKMTYTPVHDTIKQNMNPPTYEIHKFGGNICFMVHHVLCQAHQKKVGHMQN